MEQKTPDISAMPSSPVPGSSPVRMMGLIPVASPAEVTSSRDAAGQPAEPVNAALQVQINGYITKCFEEAAQAKQPVEARIIAGRDQCRGKYDATKLAEIEKFGGSTAFIKTTGTKVKALKSWLTDILMPPGDKPWELQPTPVPDLPDDKVAEITEQVTARIQQHLAQENRLATMDDIQAAYEIARELRSSVQEEEKEEARQAAAKAEDQVADQLVEGKFASAFNDFLYDLCHDPTAILKAPVYRTKKTLNWNEAQKAAPEDKLVREVERVDSLNFYPSARSRGVDTGYICERIPYSRKTLIELRGTVGVNDAMLDEALRSYGQRGYTGSVSADASKDTLEGRTVAANTGNNISDAEIYGIEFWGSMPGKMLIEWGMEGITDELAEFEIMAIQIGRYVIKAVLNPDPLGRRPYFTASYENIPGSIWGESLAETMSDLQDIQNSNARAFVNNFAMCSGPQVGVDASALPTGFDVNKFWPWRIWPFNNLPAGTQPPIHFFQPVSNIEEGIRAFQHWDTVIEDVTGVPKYSYGGAQAGGAGDTATGLAMLMNNATKRIKDIVMQVDSMVIRPLVERYYQDVLMDENLNPDGQMKGDCKVSPRGAVALIVKEQMQLRRQEFLDRAGGNPVMAQVLGVEGIGKILMEVAKGIGIHGLDDEIKANIKRLTAPPPPQTVPVPGPGAAPAPSAGGQPPVTDGQSAPVQQQQ